MHPHAALAALAIVCTPVLAHTAPTAAPVKKGTVVGTITDAQTGDPVSDATVLLVPTESDEELSTLTTANGTYRIEHTAPITAKLTIKRFGYATQILLVKITAGRETTQHAQLERQTRTAYAILKGRIENDAGQGIHAVVSFVNEPDADPFEFTGGYNLVLTPGEHTMIVRAEGYMLKGMYVHGKPGDVVERTLVLRQHRDDRSYVEGDKIILRQPIAFTPKTAKPNPASFGILDEVLDILFTSPDLSIIIRGYAKDYPTAADNKRLGTERAKALKAYFVSCGIDDARITTFGHGPPEPNDERPTSYAEFEMIQ